MSESKQILIVGCGRLGGALATRLSLAGHQVVVVDRKEASFEKLGVAFSGFKLIGDAVELHVLKDAGIERSDILFATTTADNTNLMIAQVARQVFQVQRVVARVFDPAREAIYRDFGIETISPTQLVTEAFLKVVR
jgi:trk system potassium uptake protein TrkA